MTIEFRRNPTRITKAEVSGASDNGATVHLTLRIGLRPDQLETFPEGRYALSDLRVYGGLLDEWRARRDEAREKWDAMIDRLTADHQAAVKEADESGTPRPRPPRELGMSFSEPPAPELTRAQRTAASVADQFLNVIAEYTDEMTHEVRQAVIERGIKGTPKLVTEGGEAFLEARLNPTYLSMEGGELWSWLRMTGRELVITDVQMGIDEAGTPAHYPRTFAEHLLAAMLGGETPITAGLVVLKRLRDRGESEGAIVAEATALADDESRPEALRTAAAAVLRWAPQEQRPTSEHDLLNPAQRFADQARAACTEVALRHGMRADVTAEVIGMDGRVAASSPPEQIDIEDLGAGVIDARVSALPDMSGAQVWASRAGIGWQAYREAAKALGLGNTLSTDILSAATHERIVAHFEATRPAPAEAHA